MKNQHERGVGDAVRRRLIRRCEQLSARLVRALKASDSEHVLGALLALNAFVDEGLAGADDVHEKFTIAKST